MVPKKESVCMVAGIDYALQRFFLALLANLEGSQNSGPDYESLRKAVC